MHRRAGMRYLENGAFKGNITGPSRRCDLWIDGRLHLTGIRTLGAAMDEFNRYVTSSARPAQTATRR